MNISIEEKKTEAIRRMKMLGIFPETIKQFEAGYVSRSEPPFGAYYWVEGEELEALRKFEEEHDCLVYTVVRSYTSIGMMDSYLFVGDDVEEWELDRDDLKDGYAFSYTVNYDAPDCSEFGTIGIKLSVAAGLVRTS
jgi:hypothetical protein|nr:MAG TPA: hypothetical protein [Caudoviricetes sp.]